MDDESLDAATLVSVSVSLAAVGITVLLVPLSVKHGWGGAHWTEVWLGLMMGGELAAELNIAVVVVHHTRTSRDHVDLSTG